MNSLKFTSATVDLFDLYFLLATASVISSYNNKLRRSSVSFTFARWSHARLAKQNTEYD